MTTADIRTRILDALSAGPSTTAKIARAIGMTLNRHRVRLILADLVKAGTVTKAGVIRHEGMSNREVLWGLKQ